MNYVDPWGLTYWDATNYWAGLKVRGNFWQKIAADIFGPISAMTPDIIGMGGQGTASNTISGTTGIQKNYFTNTGEIADYSMNGIGFGTPQLGASFHINIGWYNKKCPPKTDNYEGQFNEISVNLKKISITFWWDDSWFGIAGNVGPQLRGKFFSYHKVKYDKFN